MKLNFALLSRMENIKYQNYLVLQGDAECTNSKKGKPLHYKHSQREHTGFCIETIKKGSVSIMCIFHIPITLIPQGNTELLLPFPSSLFTQAI